MGQRSLFTNKKPPLIVYSILHLFCYMHEYECVVHGDCANGTHAQLLHTPNNTGVPFFFEYLLDAHRYIYMLRDSKVINFGLVVLVRLPHHPPVLGKAWLALFTHHVIAFHMEL